MSRTSLGQAVPRRGAEVALSMTDHEPRPAGCASAWALSHPDRRDGPVHVYEMASGTERARRLTTADDI